jgi:serine/threonine protein kinase
LKYIAEITLAIMAMHTKNILHRDIKTQNIFVAKNGILKLGDFGISRTLESRDAKAGTSCGTPLFMPPEVCLGKPYDYKADVWAVGVILYELITLRKPFESETINGVLQQIVKCAFEPLPEKTDPNLKMLVVALLNKDYLKRPTIFEVASIPCVRQEILKFIQEHNC